MKFHREAEQFKPVTIILETPQECAAYAMLLDGIVAAGERRLGLIPTHQYELYQLLKEAAGGYYEALCNKVSVEIEVKEK